MELPREREIALVVRSERPADVLERIAADRALGPYRLDPLPEQAIEDVYLDTRDEALHALDLGLRRRRVDGETLLTVKGRTQGGPRGPERVELEQPWSADALTETLAAVGAPPLGESDLRPVQERETLRTRRAVVDDARTLAELALDRVRFRSPAQAVLYELEIEARHPAGDPAALAELLRAEHDELAPWPFSKLATGKAIAGTGVTGEVTAGILERLGTWLSSPRHRETPPPSRPSAR